MNNISNLNNHLSFSPLLAARALNARYQQLLIETVVKHNNTPLVIKASIAKSPIEPSNVRVAFKELLNVSENLLNSQAEPATIPPTSANYEPNQTNPQRDIEGLARLLAHYLKLKQTNHIDNQKFFLNYDSNSQIITYYERCNEKEKLEAKWVQDRWLDLESQISREKETELISKLLKAVQLKNLNEGRSSRAEGRSQLNT